MISRNSSRFVFFLRLEYSKSLNVCCFICRAPLLSQYALILSFCRGIVITHRLNQCVLKDLFDRQIVGFSTGSRIDAALCERALNAAIWRYKPGPGLIHHSDQGVQYASTDYQELLKQNHIIPSMSRKGTPYDNTCAESFFSTIKLEMVYHEHYSTRAQAQAAIFEYIEAFYNRQRRNAAIGNLPPAQFRRRFYQRQAA